MCPPGSDTTAPHTAASWTDFSEFLRGHSRRWHTRFVLNTQPRFFYGYRPAVPVV